MNKTAVKKVIKDISRPVAETAKIISVDIDRVSIQIGSSPNVIRNVSVMGSAETMAPGMSVRIMWVDRRPVVVGGASSDVGTVVVGTSGSLTELPLHSHLDNDNGGVLASYISAVAHSLQSSHLLGVNVPHDDHGYLSGLGDDDHGQYVHLALSRTITAQHIYAPTGPAAPFSLTSNAMGQTVAGLKADQLNKSVTVGVGLTGGGSLASDISVAMGTPSTLTEGTSNSASGTTHAHAVTASAAPGIAASLLKTTVSGLLILDSLTITNSAQLKGSTVARTIGPEASYTYDLGSLSYWWRKAFISEMAGAVMSEYTQAVAGGWITVCKDQGTFAAAVGSAATTMDFGKSMASYIGNIVLIRHLDAAGANKVEFVSITSLSAGTVYNVSRDLAVANSPDPAWAIGTPYAVLGTTNDGYIELDAFDSPRFSIFKKTGTAWNGQSEIVRLGDLTGHPIAGASDVGIFIGDASQYLKYSAGVLTIAGNGSGLTQINGGNIQTGTIAANKLSVSSLSAIAANMGALTVDNTLTISGGGKLLAGGGTVVLDTAGLKITSDLDPMIFTPTKALNFIDNTVSSSVAAYMTGYTYYTAMGGYDTFNTMDIRVPQKSDREGAMSIFCYGHHSSSIELMSTQSYTGLVSNLAIYTDGNSGNTGIRLTTNSTIGKIDLNGKYVYINSNTAWHAGNDGAGSGLDADLHDGYHAGNANGNIPISNGTANANLNADLHDGYHAGNANGNVPISNGTANANLNADMHDGYHAGVGASTIPYADGNNTITLTGSKLSGSTAVGCRIMTNANINVTNGYADNTVAFAQAIYDDYPTGISPHWSSGANTKMYIRVAGVHTITANLYWPVNGTGSTRFMALKVNGTTWIAAATVPANGTQPAFNFVTTTWRFAAGDYVELILRQDSTANPLVVAYAPYYSVTLAIAHNP